jgi:hypothetical protein
MWHTLRVAFKGTRVCVLLDGKGCIEQDDSHVAGPGAVGVWTKADSVTRFDDFSCQPAPRREGRREDGATVRPGREPERFRPERRGSAGTSARCAIVALLEQSKLDQGTDVLVHALDVPPDMPRNLPDRHGEGGSVLEAMLARRLRRRQTPHDHLDDVTLCADFLDAGEKGGPWLAPRGELPSSG